MGAGGALAFGFVLSCLGGSWNGASAAVWPGGGPSAVGVHSEFQRSTRAGDLDLAHPRVAQSAGGGPEQIHINLGGPGEVVVSWVTNSSSEGQGAPEVQYGISPALYAFRAKGSSENYVRPPYNSGTIHHAILSDIVPGRTYFYRVTGPGGSTSKPYSFKAPPGAGLLPQTYTFGVVGDLGQTSDSVTTLKHLGASGSDIILHVGDLSYADNFQPRWDTYARLLEPVAAKVPWMTTNGNHEVERTPGLPLFQSYLARYRMPHEASGSPSPLFYSFEAAGVHFAFLSCYTAFSTASPQYNWLKKDLAGVARSRTPWLVVVLHAPWYNSNLAHHGEMDAMQAAMEPLLAAADVDVVLAGHVHAYERSFPVVKGKVSACGPTYINIGDGGNREGLAAEYEDPQPAYSAFREASFGHGLFEVHNATHAAWAWHRNQDGEPVVGDSVQFARAEGCGAAGG